MPPMSLCAPPATLALGTRMVGWIVNQVDRYLDKDRPDPWGVWIPDRFGLPRQETTKP